MARGVKVRLNNADLLRWARESAGYGLEEMAAYLGKPVDAVRAWEEGRDSPTYSQLRDFAHRVHRPVAALFLPDVPEEPPLPEDFRMLPGETPGGFSPKARLAFRGLRNSMGQLRTIVDDLDEALELSLPTWPTSNLRSIVARATDLRLALGITVEGQTGWRDEYEALNAWRAALFERGVLVQVFPVPVDDVRAFSLLEYRLGGVGISAQDAPPARIFSLFHEVAHLCLRKPGVSGEVVETRGAGQSQVARLERYCDAFSAAFLLPHDHAAVRAAMEEVARDFSMGTATRRAGRFQVSKYVIARRMLDLGLVDRDHYWSEIRAWREQDARKAVAKPTSSEGGPNPVVVALSRAGRRYAETVMEAVDRGVLTAYEAGKLLSLSPDRLEDVHALVLTE